MYHMRYAYVVYMQQNNVIIYDSVARRTATGGYRVSIPGDDDFGFFDVK